MNNETWKQIEDYPNYFVSNTGKIRNVKTGKELIQGLLPNGYLRVHLKQDGKDYSRYVHRLVAQAFIPNPLGLDTVDHLDGNKLDNRVDNLRWLSNHDNVSRFHKEQASEEWKKHQTQVHKIYIRNAYEACKKPVICTETGIIYESGVDADRKLGFGKGCVNKVVKGKQEQTHGLHFEYL